MQPFVVTNVFAPVDLSESSVPALRFARVFADRFAATLTVFYADPIPFPADFAAPPSGDMFLMASKPEHQAAIREELERFAAPILSGRPYTIEVGIGQPVPTILNAAEDRHADFIVIGTHLRHGWRRALLGSISESVLHGSRCPVLTVANRERAAAAVTNILCPVNFSDVARDSLHAAGRLAQAFGAKLTVVHVAEGESIDEARVREWIEPSLRDVCAYRELVVRGGAAERVLDCAEDIGADLLVIGAQHKFFRDVTVIGTTTERLIRFAPSPVLVIPREAASESERKTREESLASV